MQCAEAEQLGGVAAHWEQWDGSTSAHFSGTWQHFGGMSTCASFNAGGHKRDMLRWHGIANLTPGRLSAGRATRAPTLTRKHVHTRAVARIGALGARRDSTPGGHASLFTVSFDLKATRTTTVSIGE